MGRGAAKRDIPARGKGAAQYPRFGGGKEVATVGYRALYHDDKQLRGLFDGAEPELPAVIFELRLTLGAPKSQ